MNKLSSDIRTNIFDIFRLEQVFFAGDLADVDFLSRLYDLQSMPSYDSRFDAADGDIWQHRHNNDDWEDDWVFGDPRFNLSHCSTEVFLRFLCETLHPIVRPNVSDAVKLAAFFNEQLAKAGWVLVEDQKIAGRSVFVPKRLDSPVIVSRNKKSAAEVFSSNWMQTEIERMENSIDSDPALAIGTAKDLIESCCKTILAEFPGEVSIGKSDDLPTLSKKMCKILGLVPEGIPSEAKGADTIRRTLSNLASITKGVAELRGLYGSGHGREGSHIGLESRHARLAATSAMAFVEFATETYLKRTTNK